MGTDPIRVLCVCGARPNFVKIAPLVDVLRLQPNVEVTLVHTGQHFDERMSQLFFQELEIPRPDFNLEVGGGAPGHQIAEIMRRFEPVCRRVEPDWVVVVGDVNSTLAAALVASKLDRKVAHVEAGLRSFDRTMPEEINRVLTDQLSDLLFVTEPSGVANLKREGIGDDRIRLVGNVMIDTLIRHRDRAMQSTILSQFSVEPRRYGVLTLHRPSNVDQNERFAAILSGMERIAQDMPIVFPVHPRTRGELAKLSRGISTNIIPTEPMGYLDFLKLMSQAAAVFTDSGGIQEETTILGIPCLTLRENTERPITITHGANRLAGRSAESILAAYVDLRAKPTVSRSRIPLWDGKAAARIAACLLASEGTSCPVARKPVLVAQGETAALVYECGLENIVDHKTPDQPAIFFAQANTAS